MRYREGSEPLVNAPPTEDFVTLTVWMTFGIGALFLVTGLYARQRWLSFWGALTLIACGGYFWYVSRY